MPERLEIEELNHLFLGMSDYIWDFSISEEGDDRITIEYTETLYDLIDQDLDMDEDYHALFMQRFYNQLKAAMIDLLKVAHWNTCSIKLKRMISRQETYVHECVTMTPEPEHMLITTQRRVKVV